MASAAALPAGQDRPAQVLFRDITREAGITFQRHSAPEKKYIVESMSGGLALFDFDNDGLLDVYFVNSLTVDTAKNPKAARSALYRNLGRGKFEDVTDRAGVGHPGWGMGACTADVDGDGRAPSVPLRPSRRARAQGRIIQRYVNQPGGDPAAKPRSSGGEPAAKPRSFRLSSAAGLETVLSTLAPLRFRIWKPALARLGRRAHGLAHR